MQQIEDRLKTTVYSALSVKTIAIGDEVYRKLVSIKGDETFSEVIDELISRNVDVRIRKVLELAEAGTERVEELERIVEEIRRSTSVRL